MEGAVVITILTSSFLNTYQGSMPSSSGLRQQGRVPIISKGAQVSMWCKQADSGLKAQTGGLFANGICSLRNWGSEWLSDPLLIIQQVIM